MVGLARSVHRWGGSELTRVRAVSLVVAGFAAAILINFAVLPGDHLVSSLYLLPVLFACHVWHPKAVAITALGAALLYIVSAQIEERPLTVWPFGVLAFVIGGYLTVQYSLQREEIARRALRESEERQRLQVFMGMVAHELAGSVTNIMAGAEMLAESPSRGSQESDRVAVAAINSGTRQARRLLTDLRDAAAIGAGEFRVAPGRMDVVELATEIVAEQRLLHADHAIIIDAPERIGGDWDRERVGQLLANLISNACKYSRAGSEVRVVLRGSSGRVAIGVHDEGMGIAPDQRERIFEPFARGDGNSGVAGTGLGLWISKAIAEAHGGSIVIESEEGRGSRFTAILPTAVQPNDARGGARRAWAMPAAIERSAPQVEPVQGGLMPAPAESHTGLPFAFGEQAR